MSPLKLMLGDTLEYDFSLFAIHCALEDYRIAYFLNKYANLQLKRERRDIDLRRESYEALFSFFTFEDSKNYQKYSLVANRCKVDQLSRPKMPGLFDEISSLKFFHLIPELKKADYFLKLDTEVHQPQKLLIQIKQIPQVITAYSVDVNQLKSKKNLILE